MSSMPKPVLPHTILSGAWNAGHVQGIALNAARDAVYFSFTDMLVKTRLDGSLIGTVEGLVGHMGCLAFSPADGRVYASLEYKQDAIGAGIRQRLGLLDAPPAADGFYIAIFDGERITRPGMSAEEDGVMRCVHLQAVLDDYSATVPANQGEIPHRYGCSGIDGLSFGPDFGMPEGSPLALCVAYGVYGDPQRTDNDHQVLLRYDVSGWDALAAPLRQSSMHRQGPAAPDRKYFVYTGNTTYGIQNLEYDAHTGNWLAAVYRGKKPAFPNYSLYIIDGRKAPKSGPLRGITGEEGLQLSLLPHGLHDASSGIHGWESRYGTTGLYSLGDGYFYISHDHHDAQGYSSEVCLYRWTGDIPCPFERVY